MNLTGISLGVLNEAILAISGHEDFLIFWQSVCRNVKWLIPAKKVCIVLVSDSQIPQIVMQYEAGHFLSDLDLIQPTDLSFYQKLISSKKGIWLENQETNDELFKVISNHGDSTVLSVPLRSNNIHFGTLLISTNNFDNDDKKDLISALNLYSCHIATNYRLIKNIESEKQSKNKLEKLTADLLQSEMNYKELLASQEVKIIERTSELIFEREKLNKAQISNDILQNFAYIASHDLQTPLRAINGYTQILARRAAGKLNEDELKFLGFITDGTKRMQLLITSLLEYSKIDSEKINYTSVDLNKIVEIIIKDLKDEIDNKKAMITYDNLPTLMVEKNYILRLFSNLISNSLKYSSDQKPEIKITVQKENDHYLFSLSDNGIGIKENDQSKIFEIFQRLNYKEDVEGTGIGLSSCRKIVELHKGKIWVESIEGQGSTFKFTIPVLS